LKGARCKRPGHTLRCPQARPRSATCLHQSSRLVGGRACTASAHAGLWVLQSWPAPMGDPDQGRVLKPAGSSRHPEPHCVSVSGLLLRAALLPPAVWLNWVQVWAAAATPDLLTPGHPPQPQNGGAGVGGLLLRATPGLRSPLLGTMPPIHALDVGAARMAGCGMLATGAQVHMGLRGATGLLHARMQQRAGAPVCCLNTCKQELSHPPCCSRHPGGPQGVRGPWASAEPPSAGAECGMRSRDRCARISALPRAAGACMCVCLRVCVCVCE